MARVAFIQQLFFEYIGTEILSAVLKSHSHEVDVFIENIPDRKSCFAALARFSPDILAFSCITGQHLWALETATELKRHFPRTLVLFGGPHPTFFPEIINHPAVDAICIGEGEGAIVDIAHAVDNEIIPGNIPNMRIKRNGMVYSNDVRPLIDDLDTIPFPDRSIYYRKYPALRSSRTAFLTGRGCPYNCSYCFNHSFKKLYHGKGTYVRRRSPHNILAEIGQLHSEHPIKTVYFQDDTFLVNHSWTSEFLQLYKETVGLPYICLATAEKLTSSTVRILRQSGCRRVFFGVESGDERLRQTVLAKNVSNDQICSAAKELKRCHIPFRTYNITGLPGETIEQALQTVCLNRRIGTNFPWCSLYVPLPGTKLSEYARSNGIHRKAGWAVSFFSSDKAGTIHTREMINLQKLFSWAVWLPFPLVLLRFLIRLPLSKLYHLFFIAGYGISYMRSERLMLFETVRIGMHNIRSLFPSPQSSPQNNGNPDAHTP